MDKIENILKELEGFPREKTYTEANSRENINRGNILTEGATLEEIEILEKQLNLNFPSDYKNFLTFSNGGKITDLAIYPFDKLEHVELFWALDQEELKEEGLPYFPSDKVYVIADQGDGNYIAINFSYPESKGDERHILDICHDPEGTSVIAHSFKEFLEKMLKGEKEEFIHEDGEQGNKAWYWLHDIFDKYDDEEYTLEGHEIEYNEDF